LQILLTEYLVLASDVCVVFLQRTSLIVDNFISFEIRTSIESSNLPFDHTGKPIRISVESRCRQHPLKATWIIAFTPPQTNTRDRGLPNTSWYCDQFFEGGIRLFSFQKSPAGGELDDSHVTPKSSLNILG
jgi:hypothetical protein